jgi:WD40 repeat protein
VQEVAVAFSPDGEQVATGGFAREIRIWDAASGELEDTIGPLPASIWDLAFSPAGDRLALVNFDITGASSPDTPGVHLWELPSGDLLWDYAGEGAPLRVLSVDFSPDGKTIACGTFDSVLILDAETGELITSLPIPNHVGDLAFSSDGDLLATASDDHLVRLWDTDSYELLSTLQGHGHYVNGVAFTPDGSLVISGGHDHKVGVWDVESGQLLKMLEGHEQPVLRVAVDPLGMLIASVSWDGTVRLWGVPK